MTTIGSTTSIKRQLIIAMSALIIAIVTIMAFEAVVLNDVNKSFTKVVESSHASADLAKETAVEISTSSDEIKSLTDSFTAIQEALTQANNSFQLLKKRTKGISQELSDNTSMLADLINEVNDEDTKDALLEISENIDDIEESFSVKHS